MKTADKKKQDKILSEAELNNINKIKSNEEEILAQHHDKDLENNIKSSMDKSAYSEANYSNIVFNKHELFFNSLPNEMAFDSVIIKNTGKTCVYYKWQKNNKKFKLEEKKSDGIDRFYCHYTDSKIFPDEERKFTFSFFSEKNGVFSEEWFLATTPPLKNCDLHIHLSGLVHKYVDLYSEKVGNFDAEIEKEANRVSINEHVLDLVESIKATEPPIPNMKNINLFKFYFMLYNSEYNVEFSKKIMNNLQKLNNQVMNEILGIVEEEPKVIEKHDITPRKEEKKEEIIASPQSNLSKKESKKKLLRKNTLRKTTEDKKEHEEKDKEKITNLESKEENKENKEQIVFIEKKEEKEESEVFIPKDKLDEEKYWNTSIDVLKERINQIQNPEHKKEFDDKLNCILHISHKKGPEDSGVYNFIKNIILSELEEINETSNKIREELVIPPYTFDYFTRNSLDEADLAKYEADLKKKKDDYVKKNKKKPPAKGEEEKDEMEEYREKLMKQLSENIYIKINDIKKENNKSQIKDLLLKGNSLDENYIQRLSQIKTFNNIKTEGGFDNKYAVLRIDLEECKLIYTDDIDEEGNVTGNHLSSIDYLSAKDNILQSLIYLLNNGVRVALLLVDFGPKMGSYKTEYSLKNLTSYIEKNLEHPAYFCKSLEELDDYNKKIEEDELKDNCVIVMENINFFLEECGLELIQDEFINPKGEEKTLGIYNKKKFLKALADKCNIYVNDSIYSMEQFYPTVIDIDENKIKVIGAKIQEQLKKIVEFFSIENNNYVLILGDNDVFRVKGRKQIIKDKEENTAENKNTNEENKENKEKEVNKEKEHNNENEENEEDKPQSPNTQNILDEGIIGGTETLDYSDEECFITDLLILNATMTKFKKIFIMGKLALQFIQFLRHDYEIFDNNLYPVNPNLFKIIRYILVKADLLGIEIIIPNDFKILNKEEFERHLYPYIDQNGLSKNYTNEIRILLKRERIQLRLEGAYTDPEELNENADYQRVKLEPDQLENLKYYKEKTLKINRMPYCYDFISEFQKAQNIKRPKKIFKTPIEIYRYYENIYEKELVYPEEVLQAKEYYEEKKKRLEEKNKEMEEEKENEEGDKNNKKKEEKKEEVKEEKKEEKEITEENKENPEEKIEEQPQEFENTKKEKKPYDPRLYDYDNMELVDFGEETYNRLISEIKKTFGVMWIGRLSPSRCENVFDSYIKIIQAIQERKNQLKNIFDEEQSTKEKKISESSLKAKKQLLNFFLKGKGAYEEVKETYRLIISGQANPDEFIEEDEGAQDEEQFNHDLHTLIDYYIDDDFELINSILKGKHIPGFYGLNKEKPVEKAEEFDPKSIENIIN